MAKKAESEIDWKERRVYARSPVGWNGIVGAADDDSDAAGLAQRQEAVERLLLQKRIAPGQQKQIEIATFRQGLADFPFVDAAADGLHDPLVA